MALLGSDMAINDSNKTSDPAIWYDWLEAIDGQKHKVGLKSSTTSEGRTMQYYSGIDGERERKLTKKKLTAEKGYAAAIRFVTAYAERLESKDIKEFINQLTFEKWNHTVKKTNNNI